MVSIPFPNNGSNSGNNFKKNINNDASGLIPPQNIQAEESVLGGILLDPDAIGIIADLLKPEAFYINAHKEIYKTAIALHAEGKPTDLTSMSAWLADNGSLEFIGGNNRLVELVENVSSTASIEQVANLISDKFLRRQLIRSGNEVIQLGFDQSQATNEILDKAEQKIFEISQEKPSKGLTQAGEILTNTYNEIESRALGTSIPGIPVDFYDLDAMTNGFQRSDLIILAGRPSMGKTSMVLNLTKNVAQSQGLPVCIFSLEMSKEQLTYRLLSMEIGIESGRLRSGRLRDDEWPILTEGMDILKKCPIFIDDKPNLSVLEMRSLCRRLIAEQGKELGMIIIDYLQLMEGTTDNRVQELSRITRGLKAMARELNVPVVALSQLSRGVESRTSKRPMMSDLRESGSIEQDADLVLMLYRDEYYNPDTENRGITEIIVAKHRNGPIGTVELLFEPQYTRFKNVKK